MRLIASLAALAVFASVIGCGSPIDPRPKIEVICLNENRDGDYYDPEDIALLVDGRLAVSRHGYDWQWADTHELVGGYLELYLFEYVYENFPERPYVHEPDTTPIPVPFCAQAYAVGKES